MIWINSRKYQLTLKTSNTKLWLKQPALGLENLKLQPDGSINSKIGNTFEFLLFLLQNWIRLSVFFRRLLEFIALIMTLRKGFQKRTWKSMVFCQDTFFKKAVWFFHYPRRPPPLPVWQKTILFPNFFSEPFPKFLQRRNVKTKNVDTNGDPIAGML